MTETAPYPEYKDSGLAWAPRLPAEWSKTRLSHVSTIYAGGTPDRTNPDFWTDGTVPWLNSGSVNDGVITSHSELITQQAATGSSTRWAHAGSVVVALAGQGKTKAMAARLEISSTFNQSMAAVVPMPLLLDYRFLHYWLTSNYQSIRNLAGGDLRDGLNLQHVGSIQVPLPPLTQQTAIADFLDRETAEIDAFIADQEELIGLLTERRVATITHAVTKGLDPSAPMKDSGVEWLGAVPSHWTVGRIGSSVAAAKNGVWGEEPNGGNDIRCVRVADFDRPAQRIHDRDVTYRAITESERRGRVLQRGDLLLEKSGGGERSPVGFVVLYDRDEPAVTSNFVARVQLRAGMDARYWTYVHSSNYSRRLTARSVKQSTGIQNLDQWSYFSEATPLPPEGEQTAIADYLDHETAELDATIADAREAIALSKERRAALISATVTGKIDVRGLA